MKPMTKCMGALVAAALMLGSVAALTGCSSTKAAYDAADTLEERAFVVTEHYTAVVKQAADLKDRGILAGSALTQARAIEARATPVFQRIGPLVATYNAARNAETEVELQRALDAAVLALADLVRIVKGAAGGGA